jgi:hypothetical protein
VSFVFFAVKKELNRKGRKGTRRGNTCTIKAVFLPFFALFAVKQDMSRQGKFL